MLFVTVFCLRPWLSLNRFQLLLSVLLLLYCFMFCFLFRVFWDLYRLSLCILQFWAVCAQAQGPLPPRWNPIAVNKYHIVKTLKRDSCWLKLVCNSVLPVSLKVVFRHCCSNCASTGTLILYIAHPLKVSSAPSTLKYESVLNSIFTIKYINWNQRERVEHTWPFYYADRRSLERGGWSTPCLGHLNPGK